MDSQEMPWVWGLRPLVSDGGSRWQLLLFHVLAGQYHLLPKSANTTATELGLGISESWYWYVLRTDAAFGAAVVLFESKELPAEQRGVSPFDSGGLFHGHIRFAPDLPPSDRKRYFRRYDHLLSEWRTRFTRFLARNYTHTPHYVEGRPPRRDFTRITRRVSENTARAWTWEVRVPLAFLPHSVSPRSVYLSADDYEEFLNFVESRYSIPISQRLELIKWFKASSVRVPPEDHPSLVAERDLISAFPA